MIRQSFAKLLSANDTGATGSHQAGILVPKSHKELLSFFPRLDPAILNPDAWITCTDDAGTAWKLRFIYYNNKLHVAGGTRNEYRLTHLTAYLRNQNARPGDSLVFSATEHANRYGIKVESTIGDEKSSVLKSSKPTGVIYLLGWRRVH